MIKHMAMVSIFTLMEQDMMVNGSMISNKERVENHGQMVPYLKATTLKEKKKAKDISNGLMAVITKEISRITTFMETVTINGLMVELTMVNGNSIRCMVMESLLGTMEESMKVSTTMTKSKDMVFSHGPMAEDMRVDGSMENNMEKVNTTQARARSSLENGKMERDLNGLMKRSTTSFNENEESIDDADILFSIFRLQFNFQLQSQ